MATETLTVDVLRRITSVAEGVQRLSWGETVSQRWLLTEFTTAYLLFHEFVRSVSRKGPLGVVYAGKRGPISSKISFSFTLIDF